MEILAEAEVDPLQKEAREYASKMSDHIHRFKSVKDLGDKLFLGVLKSAELCVHPFPLVIVKRKLWCRLMKLN